MQKFCRRAFRALSLLTGGLAAAVFSLLTYYNAALPDSFYVSEGKELVFSSTRLIQSAESTDSYSRTSLANTPAGSGATVELRLLGLIPLKKAHVSVVDRPVVTPGGTPFGIKLFTEGVMVVDIGSIETDSGSCSPAKEAGIEIGDIILQIDSEAVTSNESIQSIIEQSGGRPLTVLLRRDGTELTTQLTPGRSRADGTYKSGIWVRDSSAGIGTITYYEPETGNFGGLGHGICDIDTGEIMPLDSGEVCDVVINSIQKGRAGSPGELRGSFASHIPCGTLTLNCEAGIFGQLFRAPNTLESIPIKLKQEVHTGDATILTTLDGTGIGEYTVHIDQINLNPDQLTKNMLITVTDPELLEQTGGIVQGMSGSPILQDGMLVGAVTHVFVNNPARGYGIFAENMLNYPT